MEGFGNYRLDQISFFSKAKDLYWKFEAFVREKELIYCFTEGDNPYLIYCDKDKNNNKKINFLNINNGKIERTIETKFNQAVKKCFQDHHKNDKKNENGDYFIVYLEFFSGENKDINSGYLKCDLLIYPENYGKNNAEWWGKYLYTYKEICELYLNLENNTFFYKHYGCLYNDFANTKYLVLESDYIFEKYLLKFEDIIDDHYFSLSKIFYYKSNPYFLAFYHPLYIIDTKTFQIVSINHIIDEYNYDICNRAIINKFYEIRLIKDESGFPYMLYIAYPSSNNNIKYMNLITGKKFSINISIKEELKSYERLMHHGKNQKRILPNKINVIKYNNKNYILLYNRIIDLITGNIIKKEILTFSMRNMRDCICYIYYNDYLIRCRYNCIILFNLKKLKLDEFLQEDWDDFYDYNYDDYNLSSFYDDDDDKSLNSNDSYFHNNEDFIVLKIDKNRDIFKFLEYNLKYYLEYYTHVEKILKRLKRYSSRQFKQKRIMRMINRIIINKKIEIEMKEGKKKYEIYKKEEKKKYEIYIKEYESNKVKEDDEDLGLGDLFG